MNIFYRNDNFFTNFAGLYKLTLEKNPIYSLHEESLSGLEMSLW